MSTEYNIELLLRKYNEMISQGKTVYLDSDEFVQLFDYYYTLYDEPSDIEKRILEIGLQIHPDSLGLLARQMKLLVDEGKYTEALNLVRQSFRGYDYEIYLVQISCYLSLGNTTMAQKLTHTVLADDDIPRVDLLADLGAVYLEANYFQEAETFLCESVAIRPTESVIFDLAYIYRTKGATYESIRVLNLLLDTNPYNIDAWIDLANDYGRLFSYAQAIEALEFALSINEKSSTAIFLKAHYLSRNNQIEEAIQWAQEGLEITEDVAFGYTILVNICFEEEEYQKAWSYLQQWAEKSPYSAEMVAKTTELWLRLGQIERANRYLEHMFEGVDDPNPLWQIKGELMFQQRQYLQAEGFFWFAIESNTHDALAYDRLSSIYIAEQRYTEAIQMLKKMADLAGDIHTQDIAYFREICIYIETSREEKLQQMIEKLPLSQMRRLIQMFSIDMQDNIEEMSKNTLAKVLISMRDIRIIFKNIKY